MQLVSASPEKERLLNQLASFLSRVSAEELKGQLREVLLREGDSLPVPAKLSLLLTCLKSQPTHPLHHSLAETLLVESQLLHSDVSCWRLFRLMKPFLQHFPFYVTLS